MGNEEFVGPFANWANVQTACGATGNGATDDTAAIQKCLSGLSATNPTIYFPPGTYLISKTLNLSAQQFVNVIGADPATTAIVWGGASGGAMPYLNGNAQSRFDRLTFNGKGKAGVDVDQSWNGSTGYFDTENEYADDVFENAGVGFRCGNLGDGCAETSMLRDQFVSDSAAGVSMMNYNALDMFIWYSLFKNNGYGATNMYGAGNFHIFNSILEASAVADIGIGNAGIFNFRNNYSIGSKQFLCCGGAGTAYNITVEGNTILDTMSPLSIQVAGFGPLLLIDNIIRSSASVSTGPVAQLQCCYAFTDLFAMGNTFTASSPVDNTNGQGDGHFYHSINNQVVARSTVNPVMPSLPGTPPNDNRKIFEVRAGSTAAQIQAMINSAAASGTTNPVVHLEAGNYSVSTTLLVPAGQTMQIVGDGGRSQLTWTGSGTGPVMRLQGPSKATLSNFSVSGNRSANGIEIDDVDQAHSSVFIEEAWLAGSQTGLLVDALDNTNVQLHDFYHQNNSSTGATSVVVTGGPDAAAGRWQGGVTNVFAGAACCNYISYKVSNGAHVSVRDIWYDSGTGGLEASSITGASTFTYAGSEVAVGGSSSPSFLFSNFQGGTAALLNLNFYGTVSLTGSGTGSQVLGLGLVSYQPTFWNDTTKPADTTEFLDSQTYYKPPSGMGVTELAEQGTADPTFLTTTLNQIRTQQPTLLAPLATGVTDVRLYRIFVNAAAVGIHLEAN
jgi:Pectate lyase superfamily protein